MENTFLEKASHKEQEVITAGIVFDLKNLLSAIKGNTILMINRANSDHYFQPDFNEIVILVEESIIRAELISIPMTNFKDLIYNPVRLCE